MDDKLVPIHTSIKPHDAIKLIEQSREAIVEVQKLLIEWQNKKKRTNDVTSLISDKEYIRLTFALIKNNIKAGGYLPYSSYVILTLEALLIDKEKLNSLCDEFEGENLSALSTNLIKEIKSYIFLFHINVQNYNEISSHEINLFCDICIILKEEERAAKVIDIYNYKKRKSIKLQKRLANKSETEEICESFKNELWTGKYNLIALITLYSWAISILLRLNEVDLALEIEKYIPTKFEEITEVRQLKSCVF